MLEASKKSFLCDYSLYQRILSGIAEPMTLTEQHNFLKATSKTALKIFEDMRDLNALIGRTEGFKEKQLAGNDCREKNYQAIDKWKEDIAELRGNNDIYESVNKLKAKNELNKD